AYLKAKEGSLYFLPRGILYGFKKPTVFFPFSCIASTHYCGIMQHTFNIALVLHKGQRPLGSTFASSPSSSKDDEEITVEFSMIEQSEYSGIDAYIKTTGINDKSMSEELRAPEVKTKNAESSTQFTTQELNDDDEEENDDDFHPSDDDEDPLEYDSEAESSDNMEAVDDDDDGGDDDENHKERLGDDD
ncbi:histone chaperone Rttp106-like-domain-containing protein, partial [Dichotomocladium elegans]